MKPSENNGTILLVDNDLYLNNAIQNEFYRRDYNVIIATSFSGARAILKDIQPDIILMESILPDGDGFDFCRELNGKTTASIVFISSKQDAKDEIEGIKAGCNGYIKKPFRKEIMMVRVEAEMRQRKERARQKYFVEGVKV